MYSSYSRWLSQILSRDLPCRFRILGQVDETSQLFFFADVQPEFDHHDPIVGQCPFEAIDLFVGPDPVWNGRQPFDALHEHAAVPTAVEDRHLAASG